MEMAVLFTNQVPFFPNATDNVPYELGMKFRSAKGGKINAIRFWKAPSETGTHIGKIWTSTGTLLGSVTFTNETASGWQNKALSTPVNIQANTTYVVSVNVNAYYVATYDELGSSIVNGDLSSVADGNNGVFNGTAGAFPTNSFRNSNYYRDIDFVAVAVSTITKVSGDNQTGTAGTSLTNPLVVQVKNSAGNPQSGVTVSFAVTGGGGSVSPASAVTNASGQASTTLTLGASSGTNTVSATAAGVGSVTFSATASPSGTITKVSGDNQTGAAGTPLANPLVVQVKNSAGNPQSGVTVNFAVASGGGSVSPASAVTNASGQASTTLTLGAGSGTNTVSATATGVGSVTFSATASPSGNSQKILTTQVPSFPNATDNVPYELGMKFRSAKGGQITAIRFWKAPSETGTHTGKIWTATGTLLASVTFTNETASGWQDQALSTPINIQANTTYVVSVNINAYYVATYDELGSSIVNGDLSSVADGNNGVFNVTPGAFPTNSFRNSNYYRDINFFAVAVSTITKVSGDNQTGAAGTTLPNPLVVQVKNSAGNPQSGVTVNFAVTSGGGSVSPASAVTNASGQASTTLTLGASSGTNAVSATATGVGSVTFSATVTPANPNPIYLENLNPGTTNWKFVNKGSGEIAGYASATSVNKGGLLDIKVSLGQAGQFTIDVYRLGFYGGTGGRLMPGGSSGLLNGTTQAACTQDPNTNLVECNWTTSYVLQVGNNWTTGLYVAKLTDKTTSKEAHVWFVVRDDSSTADILFQSAASTVLAYSPTGGASLYPFNSINGQRAFKVSYDRPYGQSYRQDSQEFDTPLRVEYNMVRWLESQAYNVTYITNMDVHANAQPLLNNKVFLSVGHDEYWSPQMRDHIEAARSAGKNLAFFSANTCYWQVRFESSTSAAGQVKPDRVMACYKGDWTIDPVFQQQGASAATNKYRQNNRPENSLLGVMYTSYKAGPNWYGGFNFVVNNNSSDSYYANTNLQQGDSLPLLVGPEWDAVINNGSTPPGLVILSESPVVPDGIGNEFEPPAGLPPNTNYNVANSVRYTTSSGAKVFSIGTNVWAWGLDSDDVSPAREDTRAKQITVNVLADMGARPQTPNANLVVP
jgi:Domain of unknown function (DUF4082)/Bacterial Ig-like domain (group 1)